MAIEALESRSDGGMVRQSVYIAGPIKSRLSIYKEVFAEAAAKLEKEGFAVLNPATLPLGLDDRRYLPMCLSMLESADYIYLLPGWVESDGARLELSYAEYQGIPVWPRE